MHGWLAVGWKALRTHRVLVLPLVLFNSRLFIEHVLPE